MIFSAEDYLAGVLAGDILTNRWVRLAAERHRADLQTGHERGLYFDEMAAKVVIAFYQLCHHYKGEWAGQVIELEPWQQFILWVLFGWKRADGTRRYRTAYLEVARKNGKTTMAAGVGLYLMIADGEPGAEIYTAATKRDQAKIAHRDATEMVRLSPQLQQEVNIFKDNLHSVKTASKFEPLSRDYNSLAGLNCHGVIADEVHEWKTRDLWDVLETSTGARRQPLMLAITTAGYDRASFCWTLHDHTKKILDGTLDNDHFFGIIYSLDEGDDWENEELWPKANPNLGVSKKWDQIREHMARAKQIPAELNDKLRFHFNEWTQAVTRWIPVDYWNQCGAMEYDAAELAGRRCFAGLDLATVIDVAAFVLVFPPIEDDEPYKILCRFWVPEDNMRDRVKRDRVPYDAWNRHGYLTATPGNVIDYDYIFNQITRDFQTYDLREVAFDRWGAGVLSQQLISEGILMVEFGQGYKSMSQPTKDLERLIRGVKLAHGDQPVLNWMAGNMVVEMDAAGNYKPSKAKSTEKIDGMVALIMGLDRALKHEETPESVYEGRGIITI